MKDFYLQASMELMEEDPTRVVTTAMVLERAEKLKAEFLAKGTP